MIEAILVLVACAWLIYKFSKTKNLKLVFAAVVVFSLQLARWPFFLPVLFPLSLIAFFSAGFMFYEHSYKRKTKNMFQYILMFVMFGLVFLVEALF